MIQKTAIFFFCAGLILSGLKPLNADSEVIRESSVQQVVVREHPRTGNPYIAVTAAGNPQDPFLGKRAKVSRPDYQMLDPKVKSGQIPYDGPSSDRKKVYILAASLATIGAVGGTAIIASAPAATGAGATTGAGAYAGAGAGIAAGTLGGSIAMSRSGPEKDNFTHVFESHAVKSETFKNQETIKNI